MANKSMPDTLKYLKLIQDTKLYLQQNPYAALSSGEDCEYFRQKFKESLARKKAVPYSPPVNTPLAPIYQTCEPVQAQIVLETKPPIANPEGKPIQTPQQPIAHSQAPAEIPPPVKLSSTPQKAVQTPPTDSLQWPILSFGKWKTLMGKIAPELHILSEVPSDALAKKISSRWKTKNLSAPITILSFQEIPEQKELLEQITLALDVHFGPSKLVSAEIIEKDQQWDTFLSVDELKLIITCDYTLWQLPGLLKFYKESPTKRQIGEKDLFLLPDLSLYLKDPLLKRSLWKALCQTCEPLLPLLSLTRT